ncbi:MAG: hypothetical protein KJ971_07945 [Firmicutes bacterium]|nr:hypothetical protein [Bacillota bacterium]
MKKLKLLLGIMILGLIINPFLSKNIYAENIVHIYFFYDEVCAHCAEENLYLIGLEDRYSNIEVHRYEITQVDENNLLFEDVKTVFNELDALTPYTVIGGVSLRGFNPTTENDIVRLITRYSSLDYVDVVNKVLLGEEVLDTDFDSLELSEVDLPFIGPVSIDSLSIFLAGILMGFVDGFNPCAMWVLLFLITMLINTKDRKKMWILGFTFLFASALFYFLIMVAWLNLALQITTIVWIRIVIGSIALGFGGFNIYQFIKSTKNPDIGCEVTDRTKKQKLMDKVKKIVTEQKLFIALIGIIFLAVSVNVVELACSAGLPLVYIDILAYNQLSMPVYILYILLYIFFFLLDDLIIFSIAMISFKVTGISNKYSKFSHIIGGIIMIIIGFLLIFFPQIVMFNF